MRKDHGWMRSLTDGTDPMISVESNGSDGGCGGVARKKVWMRNEGEDSEQKESMRGNNSLYLAYL